MTDNIYIEDVTALGKNINEIVKVIEETFSLYETVEIKGFGVVTSKEKDIVVNSMKLLLQANSRLWSNSARKKASTKKAKSRKALTEEQEQDVVKMACSGYKRVDIANKYSISIITVSRILKNHNVKMEAGRPKNLS